MTSPFECKKAMRRDSFAARRRPAAILTSTRDDVSLTVTEGFGDTRGETDHDVSLANSPPGVTRIRMTESVTAVTRTLALSDWISRPSGSLKTRTARPSESELWPFAPRASVRKRRNERKPTRLFVAFSKFIAGKRISRFRVRQAFSVIGASGGRRSSLVCALRFAGRQPAAATSLFCSRPFGTTPQPVARGARSGLDASSRALSGNFEFLIAIHVGIAELDALSKLHVGLHAIHIAANHIAQRRRRVKKVAQGVSPG